VDVALARDRSIASVFAGDLELAHRAGADFVSNVMLETARGTRGCRHHDIGGYPLDLTFYQSIKGVSASSHIVKPGGQILLAAACQEGAGAPSSGKCCWRPLRPRNSWSA